MMINMESHQVTVLLLDGRGIFLKHTTLLMNMFCSFAYKYILITIKVGHVSQLMKKASRKLAHAFFKKILHYNQKLL